MSEPMEHLGHLDEIARAAAAEYGQDWAKIPVWSRDIWLTTIKGTRRGGGDNPVEKCAGRAIEAWYVARETPITAPLDEPKPKKPKGGK